MLICVSADSSQWTQTEFQNWNFLVQSTTKNKALSTDLLPDIILIPSTDYNTETKRIRMLFEATQHINEKNVFLNHMCGRLVLINKAHPKVPKLEDIRPITVLSPIRKFLELQISDKIKNFCRKSISKAQTGFID